MVSATAGNTIGIALLGTIVSSMLYGVMAVQTYLYYHNFPNDPVYQKISVAILISLTSIHIALNIQTIYQYLISDFGNVYAETLITLSFKLQTTFNILIILTVNGLYALRIWKLASNLSVNKVWPAFIMLIVGAGTALGFVGIVKTFGLKTYTEASTIKTILNALFGYASAIDITMASTLCYYLQQGRATSSLTSNIIFKIMQYVLICGFLTSACSLSFVITFVTMPNTLVFIGITFILPKLYINSYLALLNSRKTMRNKYYDASVMFAAAGGSRLNHTQLSGATMEESNGQNGIATFPKIDIVDPSV